MRRWIWYILLIVLLLAAALTFFPYSSLDNFQKDGSLHLPGLKDPVTVIRDEKGMAYIYARNLHDAFMAQGFVTAQDGIGLTQDGG